MTYWIIAAAIVAVLLFALAWWSTRKPSPERVRGVDPASENARSRGNLYDRGM